MSLYGCLMSSGENLACQPVLIAVPTFPSFSRTQQLLDLASITTNAMVDDTDIPACTVSDSGIRVASTVKEINHCITVVRERILRDKPFGQQVVSIDAEWDVIKTVTAWYKEAEK